MRADVRDAINVINRFIQETKYIDVSDNKDNVVSRTLSNKEPDFVAEVFDHLNLIIKEISKVHNKGTDEQYTEKYYYIGSKEYTDIDEFKKDYLIG